MPGNHQDIDEDYDVMADQFLAICGEQGTAFGRNYSRNQIRNAIRGEAEEALPETQGKTTYSKKWKRVSDKVFAQYAPIEQRRPA